jgi:uncharacterized protein YciI
VSDPILPQADFALEELTVVLLFEGPLRARLSPEDAQRLANEHLRYTIALADAGHLVHAGAIIDREDERPVTGLGFSRKSPEEVAALVAEDPAVKAGLEAFRIVRYRFPKGGLRFAREMKAPAQQ